ncbi:MAG: TonB-dependent receptor [Acidobacteria bacterium]|nr:TonB-dependent receptor [Acidobacteriota bacterium]
MQGNQRGGNEAVFFFPQSAVNEFQVVRSGAGADIGRTAAGFVNVVTKSGTNETRGDAFYHNRNRKLTSADAFDQNLNDPQIVITGFGTLGGDTGRPRVFKNTRTQVTNNLTRVSGRTELKVGIDFNLTDAQQQRESNTLGRFDYTSLANYLAGNVSRYRQTVAGFDPDDLIYRGTQKELGIYVQDTVRLPQVTLNAGLRWDGQWNPQPTQPNPVLAAISTIPNDHSMWQPRLGMAWDVRGNARTVVRASAGLYNARTPANFFQRVFTDNGLTTVAVDSRTDPRILGWVAGGKALEMLPAVTAIPAQRVFGFAPEFQNSTTLQSAVLLDQQLTERTMVSIGYVNAQSDHLQRRLDKNLGAPTPNAAGLPIYPATRPNTAFAQIEVNESLAQSDYNALVLTATERRGRLFAQVNYTFAVNKDDDSNERNFSRETTLDVFNPGAEYTYSKQDVRHAFNISSVVNLGYGITFG